MTSSTRAALLASAGVLGAMLLAGPVLAGPPACTCQNLESLQQDYQNAVYLEAFKRRLAAELAAAEARQVDLNTNQPTHPDAGRSVLAVSGQTRDAYEAANSRLPFPRIKDYKGPSEVNMEVGKCTQPDPLLKALEDGSPCQAMADAALTHEKRHRDLCAQMGAGPYWDRLPSVVALEEAEAYKAQAADLKAELRRVLEAADVKVTGEFAPTMSIQGMMKTSYLYLVESGDIGGAMGTETWTMTGKGTVTTTITDVNIAGMRCTSGGAITSDFTATLATDGLSFSLDVLGKGRGDQVSIRCPGGAGGFNLPATDPISGKMAANQSLVSGENSLPAEDWSTIPRMTMRMAGGTLEGEAKMTLTVSCPAP